jgi:outer membrane lipoprotein-sorting protein
MKLSLLVLCALPAAASLHAENSETILARMDEAAATFKGVFADVRMTVFTKVIDDQDVQTGTLKMQRLKGKSTRALLSLSGQSDSHTVFLFDNTVQIYTPKLKLLQTYDVGKSSDLLSQFLLLGFGSSGKELMDSYDVNNAGIEKIAGQETTALVLLPKTAKVKEKLSKVEMWIPEGEAYPVQQQFFEPNGNYRIMQYSNLKPNPPIKGNLEFKPPSGTKKQ